MSFAVRKDGLGWRAVDGEADVGADEFFQVEQPAVVVVTTEQALARNWRDTEILRVTWLRDRHRDEVELDSETTLSVEQYAELLAYIKALRDWPTADDFPAEETRPVPPDWVASQAQ
ncbi:hypothetical protein EKG40_11050 [Pseudomonas moorei]|nr:hypothetical protein EKG40_11050 [Pseudomonas moorei]